MYSYTAVLHVFSSFPLLLTDRWLLPQSPQRIVHGHPMSTGSAHLYHTTSSTSEVLHCWVFHQNKIFELDFPHWITTDQHTISMKCNIRAPLYCTCFVAPLVHFPYFNSTYNYFSVIRPKEGDIQASVKEAGNKPILSAALPLHCLPTWGVIKEEFNQTTYLPLLFMLHV